MLVLASAGLGSVRAHAAGTAQAEYEALWDRTSEDARRVLAEYDAHLAARPGDAAMAIERCKFSLFAYDELASDEDEEVDLENEAGDAAPVDCVTELKERFPTHPEVLVFAVSRAWGDDAVALANAILKTPSVPWADPQKAKVYEHLVWAHHAKNQFDEAASAAYDALSLDSSLELSLPIAKALVSEGEREKALRVLSEGLNHPKQYRLQEKAELLLELDACPLAATLFERPELQYASLLHAKVLECAGNTEGARAQYAKLESNRWHSEETLLRLFKIDLASGDRTRAVASYQAFRDLGWYADPLGRQRMALALAYPTAQWRARDALGFLTLAFLVLFGFLLPLVWLLPMHHAGLWRRTHRGLTMDPGARWKLRHVWLVTGAFLVVDIVATYLFLEGELEWSFVSDSEVALEYALESLGRYGMFFFLGTALITLAMLRPADARSLIRTEWEPFAVLGTAVVLTVFFLFSLLVYLSFVRVAGLLEVPSAALFELNRMNVFKGVRASVGFLPLLVLAAVVVPAYEEIIFRWIMLDGFARHVPFWLANGLQAVIFSALHMSGVLFPFFLFFGFVLGYLRRFTGTPLAGMLAHGAYNFFVMLLWLALSKL